MTAFLGVETSLTGRRWVGPDGERDRAALALAQQSGVSPLLASVLARLGVEAPDVPSYLSPTLRELMPDPSTLLDMDKAASIFWEAVKAKRRIAVFADYDVDGGASAALLLSWMRDLGQEATLYVPDRIDEGYGPNDAAMISLAKDHDLIICVDCGTLSHSPIEAAVTAGATVIVLDHHLGGETLPPAAAVVNPNRQDEESPLTYLCAAGVVFMMLVAVNRLMRNEGQTGPDLTALLDLVALATVADVAPLLALNRAFVRQGLKIMRERRRPGLVALSDVAKITSEPNSYHLGFLLGPRINAGGRIGRADLGAALLAMNSPHEAAGLAEQLDVLNKERRAIEARVLDEALEQAEARGFAAPLVWASAEGWHPGVVGIVASRLKEASNRPSVVIGFDQGVGKGSGRSVSGIDLGAAIATVTREGLLEKGGGHKMAAGLTVNEDKLEAAMERLSELLDKQGASKIGPRDLSIDGALDPQGATVELIDALETAGPFGAGAPAPRVALPAQKISFAKQVGEGHLSITLDGAGQRVKAIAFGAFKSEMGPALSNHRGAPFHLAGRLEVDDWGGQRKPKLRLEDAAPV